MYSLDSFANCRMWHFFFLNVKIPFGNFCHLCYTSFPTEKLENILSCQPHDSVYEHVVVLIPRHICVCFCSHLDQI